MPEGSGTGYICVWVSVMKCHPCQFVVFFSFYFPDNASCIQDESAKELSVMGDQ